MNDSKGSKRSKEDSHLGKPLSQESWFKQASKKERKTPKVGGILILTLWQEKHPLPAHCF